MAHTPLKLWFYFYFVALLIRFEIQASRNGLTRSELQENKCDFGLMKWNNRGDCEYIFPRMPQITRNPYRIWEGKGRYRLIGWKHAELSCDFNQPQSIVSNIVWYKTTKSKSPGYDDIEEKIFYRPFNNFQHRERIYTVSHPGGSSLFIQNVNYKDFGIYRCIASRYAIPSFSLYPEIITVYKDVEFYPQYIDREFLY